MHEPRPHGLSAVGGEPTEEDSAAVELLARRLTNLRNLSGVDSLRMVRELPGGGYVIAQNMGGVFKAITHKPGTPPKPEPFDGIAKDYIPMLFSGVVTKAVLRDDEGLGMKLTEQCRRRIAGYKAENLPSKQVELKRFSIEYHTMCDELRPENTGPFKYTQYVAQRPTWYSGAMAEVMQIVGGYGRQDLENLPDTRIERSRISLPKKIQRQIALDLGNLRLPGYTGFPDKKGQFRYDYKFNNTNGVGFDELGKPWLLRVSSSGVHAMPLPIVPATVTNAFREWIEEVGDDEILKILDRFGGMPSGEGFPILSKDFEAWRRAGVIIKVCDTADFYHHIMYASAIGWSFNSFGTEGYNTCYDYYDEEGLGYGLAYKMSLTLGSAKNSGKLPTSFDLDSSEKARKLDAYLSSLYRLMNDTDQEHLAIKYKLRRVPVNDILSRANNGEASKSELDYWNRKELEPIAVHGGSVAEVARGYLYHGAKFMYQPQIKFPEPFMGGCVSHDFLPLINGRYKDKYPNSDTIMFGYYADDELKVVKYFREGGSYKKDIETDFEECMTVGSWTQIVTEGSTQVLGNFYTSDIDDRGEVTDTTTTTNIRGIDRGYDREPSFSFDDFFSMCGSMWRNRYFERQTETFRTEGNWLEVAVCIPYLDRNALIHAKRSGITGSLKTTGNGLLSVRDPNSYRYFTYHFVLAWVGCSTEGNAGYAPKVNPYPREGNPVWVTGYNYNPGGCSDFADQGDWVGALPQDYTWLIWPTKNAYQFSGGGGAPIIKTYSTSEPGKAKEEGELKYSASASPQLINKEIPSNMYFLGSPDIYVGVFYRDGCRITFGESEYINVSESESKDSPYRKRWGFTNLADHKSAHHFIGVINE